MQIVNCPSCINAYNSLWWSFFPKAQNHYEDSPTMFGSKQHKLSSKPVTPPQRNVAVHWTDYLACVCGSDCTTEQINANNYSVTCKHRESYTNVWPHPK